MTEFRTERDSMGEVRLPAEAYYGPQTQRAVENFPISGRTLPPELIHALGTGEMGGGDGQPRSRPARPTAAVLPPSWPPAAKWPTENSTTSFPSMCFRPARARRAT